MAEVVEVLVVRVVILRSFLKGISGKGGGDDGGGMIWLSGRGERAYAAGLVRVISGVLGRATGMVRRWWCMWWR